MHELNAQKELLRKAGIHSPWVFPNKKGSFTNQNGLYKAWTRYRIYNGIQVTSPYEMRHTFFSLYKSLPENLTKLVGGHSKMFDTQGTYGHEVDGEAEKAARLINETLQEILSNSEE